MLACLSHLRLWVCVGGVAGVGWGVAGVGEWVGWVGGVLVLRGALLWEKGYPALWLVMKVAFGNSA